MSFSLRIDLSRPKQACPRMEVSLIRPAGSRIRCTQFLYRELFLKTTLNAQEELLKCTLYSTGRTKPDFIFMYPYFQLLTYLLWYSLYKNCLTFCSCTSLKISGRIFSKLLSTISSRWQPDNSLNKELKLSTLPMLPGFDETVITGWQAPFSGDLLCSYSSSFLLETLIFSRQILRDSSSIILPWMLSLITISKYREQQYRTSGTELLIFSIYSQFSRTTFKVLVILEPMLLSLFKSGIYYLSSVQKSLCRRADLIIAYSHREMWLSNLMISIKSVVFYYFSLFSKFSLIIFLNRYIMNSSSKEGSVFKAQLNYSQALFLLFSRYIWKKAKESLSLVLCGYFLIPDLYILSICNRNLLFKSSFSELQGLSFFVIFSGQSSSTHISLCFSIQPVTNIQEFLSYYWLCSSCNTQLKCDSSCSPDLNLRLKENNWSIFDLCSNPMIIPMKGSPLIQMTKPPLKPRGPSNWLNSSMKLVQKQYEDTILKNLEARLSKKGSFMLQVQYSQPERQNSISEYIHVSLKGWKLKISWQMILFIMNTTSPVEFCLAVNFLLLILGSNSARATTDDINTNSEAKSNVMAAWKRCQPCQHTTSLKLSITWYPLPLSLQLTTESRVSVMGRKKMVTKRGTSLARITRGQVNLNLFLEKEQLTQMMSMMTSTIISISAQSMMRKVLKLTPGRQLMMFSFENKLDTLTSVSPPFHAYMMDWSNGKANICRQSSPLSKMSPKMGSSDYYYSSPSSRTYSTLKMESFRSRHALKMQFCYSRPMSVLAQPGSFIELLRTILQGFKQIVTAGMHSINLFAYNKNSKQQVSMKVQIKSVLKSNFTRIRGMEEGQLIYPAGNNLCIGQIGKSEGQFLHLHKQNTKLMDFAVGPNCKSIFTAELLPNGINICSYNLQNQRKQVCLSDVHGYMPSQIIDNVELLTDQFESSVVFVVTRGRSEGCITLLDMLKLKVLAHGYVTDFEQARICSEQTYEISLCGRGFLRRFKVSEGFWCVEERLPKKLQNLDVVVHEWLPMARMLIGTSTTVYIIEDNEVLQTIQATNQQDPIKEVIKIHNGFVVVTKKCAISLYHQQNDESIFTKLQGINLQIGTSRILQIEYNRRSEEIMIFCDSGKFYYSKLDEVGSSNKENYFTFEQIGLVYSSSVPGVLSTTTGQNYCLIANEKTAELWDLNRLCPTLSLETANLSEQRVIKTCAMNPEGYSICIGYSDRIRFYHILLNKFRQFAEYPLKNASLIQYSHGGQLIAAIFGKGQNSCLTVINTKTIKEVITHKLGFRPHQVIWNEQDDEIYISGQEAKVMVTYQLSTKSKKSTLHFDNGVDYIRYDYLSNKILVSTGKQIHSVDSLENTTVYRPKIDDFHYVFPIDGYYIGTDTKGGLFCSNSLEFDKYSYLPIFSSEKFNLLYRKGTLIAYTSAANVIVLRVKVSSELSKNQMAENIVFIQKDEVNKFFERVRALETLIDQLQASTAIKLEEERKKYTQSLQQNEKKFQDQINFLQHKLSALQGQKLRQEKNNARVFDELETGQIKSVNQLEKVYDMKLRLQKEKYLTLQQQALEQKIKYDKIIKGLEQKNSNDIQKVREEYSQKLNNQLKKLNHQKQRYLQYRKKAQTKIIDIEQQGQMALFQVQFSKDKKIENIQEQYVNLQRKYDQKMITLHNVEQDYRNLHEKYQKSLFDLKQSQKTIQENVNKVEILEKEVLKKNKIIEQKNITIDQQAHQIDALEKAKYVLSFRTNEVRKELEPKQSLIEKLKTELFKLDEEYKQEVKKNFEAGQKLEKLEKINSIVKKQNNQLKTQIKARERVHNDMCSEVFLIINTVDPKQWNNQFVKKIYKIYVQPDKFKSKSQKNDDPTVEEINRHLVHVEQSLYQVSAGNQKMLKGKQKQVIRKMKQNAELVYDLNMMRKGDKEKQTIIKQKQTQISRLKIELNELSTRQRSTRANTAKTGTTRKVISRDPNNPANPNNNSDWIDLSVRRQSDYLIPGNKSKGRILSAHKTMVWRDESRREKSKLSDLARELQSAKNTIMRQDRMIEELNQRLLGLPEQNFN